MESLVSVICITRNHERFCIESLDSVLNQTYKNIEWIILDAASTDGTVDLIDNWLVENNVQAVFLKEKELKSITVNLNKALTYAHGEYVQFLSLDDVLDLDKLKIQVPIMCNNKKLFAVFSDSIIIDEKGKIIGKWFDRHSRRQNLRNYKGDCYSSLLKRNIINAPTMLVDKRKLNQLGNFDESLVFEDLDIVLRGSRHNEIDNIEKPLVYYREVSTSLSRNIDLAYTKSKIVIYLKHLNKCDKTNHINATKHIVYNLKKIHNINKIEYFRTIFNIFRSTNFNLTLNLTLRSFLF